jgi:heptosyltransferase-3
MNGWIDVIRYLAGQGIRVYVTGGPAAPEREYIDELLEPVSNSAQSIAGKLRLAEVADLLEHCRIYIGVDTVISHVAAAVGAPTVALFGPESPIRWGPWPIDYTEDRSPWLRTGTNVVNNVRIVQAPAPCPICKPEACKRRRDRGTDCFLMSGISSDQVIDSIQQMLQSPYRPAKQSLAHAEKQALA